MAEAMWRGEDSESLCTAQRLPAAEEECLGVDMVILAIVEDKLLIIKKIKKRRWPTMEYLRYAEEEELPP